MAYICIRAYDMNLASLPKASCLLKDTTTWAPLYYLFPHHHHHHHLLLQNAECRTWHFEFSVHTPFVYVLIPKTIRKLCTNIIELVELYIYHLYGYLYIGNTVSLMRLRTENIGNRFFFSEQTHVRIRFLCVPNIAWSYSKYWNTN